MIAGSKPGYLAEVRDCGSGDVRANARLIAAAPDLLAALEAAADYFDNKADADCDEDGIAPNEEMRLWSIVLAALAKAEPGT